MKTIGIISEYNPFHNGHLFQINQIKKSGGTHIVAVMSGNFVQRGDVAIFSKWARAKACLENGVDLVVELPTPLAMSPAKDFATGAISILDRLQIDAICFGSETGNKDILKQSAKACLQAELSEHMKAFMDKGISYPRAKQMTLETLYGKDLANIMLNPNDLLGIEYINAIEKSKSNIDIMPIKRENVLHDSKNTHENIASASFIREMILSNGIDSIKDFVPQSAFEIYQHECENLLAPCTVKNLEKALLYKFKTIDRDYINSINDVVEGLGNRIFDMGQIATSFDELLDLSSTKRYTNARIRRIIMNVLLDIKKGQFDKKAEYIRVLAMNERGKEILKKVKKNDGIPVIPKFANIINQGFSQAEFENKATNIYSLSAPKTFPANKEFTEKVVIK